MSSMADEAICNIGRPTSRRLHGTWRLTSHYFTASIGDRQSGIMPSSATRPRNKTTSNSHVSDIFIVICLRVRFVVIKMWNRNDYRSVRVVVRYEAGSMQHEAISFKSKYKVNIRGCTTRFDATILLADSQYFARLQIVTNGRNLWRWVSKLNEHTVATCLQS